MRDLFCFLLLTVFSVGSLFAQSNTPFKPPQWQAFTLDTAPTVDGDILNDPNWKSITPISQLTQVTPDYGQPASENTEIRVGLTEKMLYVAVVCYDSAPENIVVSDSRRDADLGDEDSFLFILDTYNDQQNGFLFGTNADGMQYDAQIDNEGEGNFSANRQQGGFLGGKHPKRCLWLER